MLLQFKRDTERYNVDFEFEGKWKWQVTSANVEQVMDSLRPKWEFQMLPQTELNDSVSEIARAHMRAILERVLEAPELEDPRWSTFSLVFFVSDEGDSIGNGGYAYGSGDHWWAFSVSNPRARPPVIYYLQDVCGRIPLHLCSVLLQHERTSGQTRLAAETADANRWRITVDNARSMVNRLKPRFDATGNSDV